MVAPLPSFPLLMNRVIALPKAQVVPTAYLLEIVGVVWIEIPKLLFFA